MGQRGFEIIKAFENKGINLPTRATKGSAGYDFEAAEAVTIPSMWQQEVVKPTLVSTGIKVYMQEDEYLELVNRSSNALKRSLMLPNGVGVIDSDYYNNTQNEGHIMFQLINFGKEAVTIEKGERIGQGIFKAFLKTTADNVENERTGGFGSSGK